MAWQELVQEIKVLTGDKEKLKDYDAELLDLDAKKKVRKLAILAIALFFLCCESHG